MIYNELSFVYNMSSLSEKLILHRIRLFDYSLLKNLLKFQLKPK